MNIPYDLDKICSAFAAYQIGDIVVSLDKNVKFEITNIKLRNSIIAPEIAETQTNNYISDCDEFNFIYTLTPVEPALTGKYDFSSSEFERLDTERTAEELNHIAHIKRKRKLSAAVKFFAKGSLLFLSGYVVLMLLIALITYSISYVKPGNFILVAATLFLLGIVAIEFALSENNKDSRKLREPFYTFFKLTSSHCIAKRKDR